MRIKLRLINILFLILTITQYCIADKPNTNCKWQQNTRLIEILANQIPNSSYNHKSEFWPNPISVNSLKMKKLGCLSLQLHWQVLANGKISETTFDGIYYDFKSKEPHRILLSDFIAMQKPIKKSPINLDGTIYITLGPSEVDVVSQYEAIREVIDTVPETIDEATESKKNLAEVSLVLGNLYMNSKAVELNKSLGFPTLGTPEQLDFPTPDLPGTNEEEYPENPADLNNEINQESGLPEVESSSSPYYGLPSVR